MKKIAIIGSGPIGAICADYLINNSSFYVDILDVGLNSSTFVLPEKAGIIPKKTLFGNAFVYKRMDSLRLIFDKFSSFDTSHAKGGLSNVWGANISALHKKYLINWKLNNKNFEESFRYVLKRLPICAIKDMIDDQYDIKIGNNHLINDGISYDICNLSKKSKEVLIKNNLSVGRSKLAVNFKSCTLCGQCMTGCSIGSIFNAVEIINKLSISGRFTYKPRILVDKFIEKKSKVTLITRDLINGIQKNLDYDFVIIAAGVVDTTNIFLKSMSLERTVLIKESKKYYFPVISSKIFSKSSDKTLALSHIYIQHLDKESLVHCQLYTSLSILEYILKSKVGEFSIHFLRPFRFLLKNIYVAMAYLDSEDSGHMQITYTDDNISVKGFESEKSKVRLNTFFSSLGRVYKATSLIPIKLILSSKLGHSQHFGSSIPMREVPNLDEVDFLGRPKDHRRTFLVDASVLPTIPASPTTVSAMANAVRICKGIINH
jgi:hypothetical protein